MRLIKNFDQLATTLQRKMVLEIIEAGLATLQPKEVIKNNFSIQKNKLKIQNQTINLNDFQRVFLVGFGKGSAGISRYIEKMLGKFLNKGFVIDLEQESASWRTNINFIQGTHPLPSQTNFVFTKRALDSLSNLTTKDLVVIVIAGGGSALFEHPYRINLEKLIEVNKTLLKSGANIQEMNTVRKHLSKVKGGGLAKLLYPATVISLISSDVPGNDLSVIASGPTVKDPTNKEDAFDIITKYNLWDTLSLSHDDFLETPKENKYFENVSNILILSNKIALVAMGEKAKKLGYKSLIYSDRFQGEAKFVGKELIEKTPVHTILLAGGETTVKVIRQGVGGRNQEVVLGALSYVSENTVIASIDSDGWDNSPYAGAIGDSLTIQKAKEMNINPESFLHENNSFSFFEKTGDGIITDRLSSNVSDLMIVIRNNNIITRRLSSIEEMYGIVKTDKILSKEEMKKTIREAVLEKFERKRAQE